MNLKFISEEIREILDKKRKEISLSFIEEEHIYFMKDSNGVLRNNFPSVSKVYKLFYDEFDSNGISLSMAKGDKDVQKVLLESWKQSGIYSSNQGSRVHYFLEKELMLRNDNFKEVREPIFECDEEQINTSNKMIIAGNNFINLMEERGAVLLDTEIILGSPSLGYTGQPDKGWLIFNKDKNEIGLIITDWKSNKPENFEVKSYTKQLHSPFNNYPDIALSHYYLQIPLYARLLLDMLKDTKYEDLKFFGGIVVLLKKDSNFVEYRVPKDVTDKIFNLDIKSYFK